MFPVVLLLLYRHYRDRYDETPSHTGGVSDVYLQKVKDKRDRDRGVYASSSKDKDRNRTAESGKKLHSSLHLLILAYVFLMKPVDCIII